MLAECIRICGSRKQQNSSLHQIIEQYLMSQITQRAEFTCIHSGFISSLTPNHNFLFQCSVSKAGKIMCHFMEVLELVLTFNTGTVNILFLGWICIRFAMDTFFWGVFCSLTESQRNVHPVYFLTFMKSTSCAVDFYKIPMTVFNSFC